MLNHLGGNDHIELIAVRQQRLGSCAAVINAQALGRAVRLGGGNGGRCRIDGRDVGA